MPPDPDLSATARGATAADVLARRLGVAGFWRWWGSELAPLVPAGTRTAMQRRRARPVLAFEADRATLWEPVIRDGALSMVERGSIPLGGDAASVAAAGRAAIAGVARSGAAAGRGGPRVSVALQARQVLRRTLVLPAAIEENLRQALSYDLDRHTPFKADELYFDAIVVGRDATRGEIRVDLAAARRPIVDAALRHAESFGAVVAAVIPESPAAAGSSRLNLLRAEERAPQSPWRRWQFWVPIALLAAITVAAIVLPLWQKRAYAIALTRATDEARGKAAVSEGLRNELERLASDYNFVLGRKYAFPSNLDVLHEVTKLLPDDTWLLQMEVKNVPRSKEPQRELLLRGESANAGRLISAFEESKVFTQAAPRSPTTKIQPGPGEIFDLAAQVRPLPSPAALALTADAAAAAESAAPASPPESTAAGAAPSAPGPTGTPPVPAPAGATPASSSKPPAAPPAGAPSAAPPPAPAPAPASAAAPVKPPAPLPAVNSPGIAPVPAGAPVPASTGAPPAPPPQGAAK
jgi:general secretion pathway protein L